MWAGGAPHAYSLARGTAGPGPRLRTALPATVPARGSDFESAPQGCRVAQGAPRTLTARPSVEGLWGSLAVPPHRHKLTSKACVYIFSRNSPGQKSPLTQTHPPLSFFVVLPSSTVFSFLCQRLGFSRIDRKKIKKELGCKLLSPSLCPYVFCSSTGIITQKTEAK